MAIPKEKTLDGGQRLPHKSFLWSFVSFACALLVLAGGYFFSERQVHQIDEMDRADLLVRVQTIAHMVNAADIASLKGSQDDLSSSTYTQTKQLLYNLHDINGGARFLYFMRPDSGGDKLMFLVDSESPTSKDYSPPGQIYVDTSDLEIANYRDAISFTEGPYTDEWGTWISGYSPIWFNGKVVAIFGMDISADKWAAQDDSLRRGILIICAVTATGFVLLGWYIRHAIICRRNVKPVSRTRSSTSSR